MLWQKSSQYQNMPHQQYMQTDEGKRAQQAFANWNNQMQGRPSASGFGGQAAPTQRPTFGKGSPYSPGKAQPMQTPSAGTAYGEKGSPLSGRTSAGKPASGGAVSMPAYSQAPAQPAPAPKPASQATAQQPPAPKAAAPAPQQASAQKQTAPPSPGMAQPIAPASTGTPYGVQAQAAPASPKNAAMPSQQQLINKQNAIKQIHGMAGQYASQFQDTYGPPSAAWVFPTGSWADDKEIFDNPHGFFEKAKLAKDAGFISDDQAREIEAIRYDWVKAGRDGQNTEAWIDQNIKPRLGAIGEQIMSDVVSAQSQQAPAVTPANQALGAFAPNTPLASLPAEFWGSQIRHDSNGDGVDDRLAGMQRPMVPIGAGGSGTASDPRFTQQYSDAGNLAYAMPDQRPQPFQAAYGQIGGGYSSQPNFAQRDAFVSNINNQLGQMQQQSWASPGSVGAPQFNFGQMWGQAGDMVQQGWKNPLAGLFG